MKKDITHSLSTPLIGEHLCAPVRDLAKTLVQRGYTNFDGAVQALGVTRAELFEILRFAEKVPDISRELKEHNPVKNSGFWYSVDVLRRVKAAYERK